LRVAGDLPGAGHVLILLPMFVVSEEAAAAIRCAYKQDGELSAEIELRRHFPAVVDNVQARACARAIAGWTSLPLPQIKARRRGFAPDWGMPYPSSATFWSLIDRWRVSDAPALELIGYEGKLPTTERRPRFRLSAEQARTVSAMLEVDTALAAAGVDAAWLHRRSDEMPRSPLDLMRAGAMDEVLHLLTQTMLQASVAPAGRSKRSPRRVAKGNWPAVKNSALITRGSFVS
jgi:hypothetical protein